MLITSPVLSLNHILLDLLGIREHMCTPSWFLVGSVLLIVIVFCVVFLCFVCLRPVSCASNVASDYGLTILDFTFGFL